MGRRQGAILGAEENEETNVFLGTRVVSNNEVEIHPLWLGISLAWAKRISIVHSKTNVMCLVVPTFIFVNLLSFFRHRLLLGWLAPSLLGSSYSPLVADLWTPSRIQTIS